MDITNSLLVAMMFVVLLTIGIGNIIAALAVTIDKRSVLKFEALHTSWMFLLLLLYFKLFWHVLDILSVENWLFLEFIYMIAGPVLMLFAAQVLIPDSASESATDLRRHYFDVARQFFVFLALLMAWIVGVDLLFGDGLTLQSVGNIVAGLVMLLLASAKLPRLHVAGTVVAWILMVGALALQGIGTAS